MSKHYTYDQTLEGINGKPPHNRYEFQAAVYGQIAVGVECGAGAWVVIHARSTLGIASFSAEHVAHNFAKEIAQYDDWDELIADTVGGNLSDEQFEFLEYIGKRSAHSAFKDVMVGDVSDELYAYVAQGGVK